MKVINLFAPPSSGKSATGQLLTGMLSIMGYKVEMVSEFAKFATWAKNDSALSDQIYMFGKQENRLHVLKSAKALDFIVMDGPLPLSALFVPDVYYANFEPLVFEVFNSYDNINYYIEKNPAIKYQKEGRNESEEESAEKGILLKNMLARNNVKYKSLMLENSIISTIFEDVTGKPAPKIQIPSDFFK